MQAKVLGRFFGSKSQKYPVRSTLSPDHQYIISGSEDGKPYLWDLISHEYISLDHLELSINGPITDVAWNPEYHMIACGGFGDSYPILVFVSKNEDTEDIGKMIEKIKDLETITQRNNYDTSSRPIPLPNYNRDMDEHFNRYRSGGLSQIPENQLESTYDKLSKMNKQQVNNRNSQWNDGDKVDTGFSRPAIPRTISGYNDPNQENMNPNNYNTPSVDIESKFNKMPITRTNTEYVSHADLDPKGPHITQNQMGKENDPFAGAPLAESRIVKAPRRFE